MTIEYAAKSDVGKVRKNNEDSFAVDEKNGLFVVCDGMGGHNAGEVASRMACDLIIKNMRQTLELKQETDRTQVMFGQNNPRLSDPANRLVSSVRLANQVIYEASHTYSEKSGMGTTVVALLVMENSYVVAWVGDSRVYLVRHKQLQQLTTDHSLVQEQVSKGLMTSEQAENSEFKNILTRALGSAENVEADAVEIPAFDNDYLLLCSDGLTRMVPENKILEAIEGARNTQEAGERLVTLAVEAGGRDNVTVIVVNRKAEKIWNRIFKTVIKAG
ncbi:MAG: Stp1/IreP family PP2C-type Ser/Thr phosphatase [Endomicrobiales bacterium]